MSNKTKKARYVINMNTGAWGFRTEMTDRLPLTFRLIDDETCKALVDGRITSKQVIEAIKKEIMSKPDFSWEEFDRQRQTEKLKLNISQHDMVPIGEEAQKEEIPDAPENVVKLSDVIGAKANGKKTTKTAEAAEATQDELPPLPKGKMEINL